MWEAKKTLKISEKSLYKTLTNFMVIWFLVLLFFYVLASFSTFTFIFTMSPLGGFSFSLIFAYYADTRADSGQFLKIVNEFEHSQGSLALTPEEFMVFFQLDHSTTLAIIDQLLQTGRFEVTDTLDPFSGESAVRIQIHFKYRRNYWLKMLVTDREFDILLELGVYLDHPLRKKDITIENNHVTRLELRGKALHSLPDSIGELSELTSLILYDNFLESVPSSLGHLLKLETLDLDKNLLSPDQISALVALGNELDWKFLWISHREEGRTRIKNYVKKVCQDCGRYCFNLKTSDLSCCVCHRFPVSECCSRCQSHYHDKECPRCGGICDNVKTIRKPLLYDREIPICCWCQGLDPTEQCRHCQTHADILVCQKCGSESCQLLGELKSVPTIPPGVARARYQSKTKLLRILECCKCSRVYSVPYGKGEIDIDGCLSCRAEVVGIACIECHSNSCERLSYPENPLCCVCEGRRDSACSSCKEKLPSCPECRTFSCEFLSSNLGTLCCVCQNFAGKGCDSCLSRPQGREKTLVSRYSEWVSVHSRSHGYIQSLKLRKIPSMFPVKDFLQFSSLNQVILEGLTLTSPLLHQLQPLLSQLESLVFDECDLDDLSPVFEHAYRLKHLEIHRCPLKAITSEIVSLSRLESFTLFCIFDRLPIVLPEVLGDLMTMKQLVIELIPNVGSEVEHSEIPIVIPPSFKQLTQLEKLRIGEYSEGCCLESKLMWLDDLPSLTDVFLPPLKKSYEKSDNYS